MVLVFREVCSLARSFGAQTFLLPEKKTMVTPSFLLLSSISLFSFLFLIIWVVMYARVQYWVTWLYLCCLNRFESLCGFDIIDHHNKVLYSLLHFRSVHYPIPFFSWVSKTMSSIAHSLLMYSSHGWCHCPCSVHRWWVARRMAKAEETSWFPVLQSVRFSERI